MWASFAKHQWTGENRFKNQFPRILFFREVREHARNKVNAWTRRQMRGESDRWPRIKKLFRGHSHRKTQRESLVGSCLVWCTQKFNYTSLNLLACINGGGMPRRFRRQFVCLRWKRKSCVMWHNISINTNFSTKMVLTFQKCDNISISPKNFERCSSDPQNILW